MVEHRPILDLEERFISGHLVHRDRGILHFQLDRNYTGAESARVSDPKLPQNIALRSKHQVFLTQPVKGQKGFWHARLDWGRRLTNPWVNLNKNSGDLVIGTASSYIENYAAIVELDDPDGIEAFLHYNEVPGKGSSIQEKIHIGDRLQSEIESISIETLEMHLSVQPLKTRLNREFLDERKTFKQQSEIVNIVGARKTIEEPLRLPPGCAVLIIEDDIDLSHLLVNWIGRLGGDAVDSLEYREIENSLIEGDVSHILLDYDLDGKLEGATDNELHVLLSGPLVNERNIPVIVISSDVTAERFAKRQNWSFLEKGFSSKALSEILMRTHKHRRAGKAFIVTSKDTAPILTSRFWADKSVSVRAILTRADQYLRDLCHRNKALGALWVRKERAGVFSIRGKSGMRFAEHNRFHDLETRLANTAAESALINNAFEIRKIERSLLKEFAPKGTNWLLAWPFGEEGSNPNRVILLFFEQHPGQNVKNAMKGELPYCRLLIHHLDTVQYAKELEDFALLGKAQAGLRHELKNPLSNIDSIPSGLRQAIRYGRKEEIESLLEDLEVVVKSIQKLSGSVLELTRENKPSTCNLKETISSVSSLAKRGLKPAEKAKIFISLASDIPDISIPHDSSVIMQPLSNLLDNALYFLKEQGWGRVYVSATAIPGKPISITVEDTGPGMTVDERTFLFDLCKSGKKHGYGMGLYISRRLVEDVGGKLEIDETVRWKGTRFILTLPNLAR